MKFCVLVKVSKRSVSFWYQSESNAYAPLIMKESNEVPLYFYVNGNDFIFGNSARDRFYSNDPNAFGNYFEIIKDPSKHFSIYGNKKPVKQLFYYGIEQYLSHFLNTVLYKNDSIESYRPHFPLRFLFETDIEDKEKSLIENLFTETGYDNVERVDYNESLFEVLCNKKVINLNKSVLLLNGIDNTLYFELYKNLSEPPTTFSKLDGQGADPRVKILADMIIEYISIQNPYLSIDKETEIGALLTYSASLLENVTPIIKGDAVLTDGKTYWFRVNERTLNDRLLFYANDSIIYTTIDDLLRSNNLNVESTTILLGSEEINTSYFLNKLLKKYPNVKGIETALTIDAMKLIFLKIIQSDYLVKRNIQDAPPVLPYQNSTKNTNIEINKPKLPPDIKTETNNSKVKLPPLLPPNKDTKTSNGNNNTGIIKPKLPEVKKENTTNKNPVVLPPLPPKKKLVLN